MPGPWSTRAFGLAVEADFALPGGPGQAHERADVELRRATAEEVEAAASPAEEVVWTTSFDGRDFELRRGRDGDHVFVYGDAARLHLDAQASRILCWAADDADPGWQRLLLDTGLWVTSFCRGFELLHASAVELGGRAVALVGRTGGGKTTLAAELVRRGHPLVSDDVVALSRAGEQIAAHPGPPFMNLPLAPPPRPQPADIGAEVARFGDEAWVHVTGMPAAALPLGSICFLERVPGAATELRRVDATALDLLPHHFGVPAPGERRRQLFEVFSDVAERVPVVGLRVADALAPEAIADVVTGELAAAEAR